MKPLVTVAIPVLNGNRYLPEVLTAVRNQVVAGDVELLIADSGSNDGSLITAEQYEAKILHVAPGEFSHGGTRNLLAESAQGEYIAFLTQDAVPAANDWLANLIGGFQLAGDIALTYGPYTPRSDASPSVSCELESYFTGMSPDAQPVVNRKSSSGSPRDGKQWSDVGNPTTFFTDANGCVLRSAWEQVKFREVPYAEDRVLAIDMLQAGYAKAFVPAAAVVHSHEYSTLDLVRRSFDEWRALREVYGYKEPAGPVHLINSLRGKVRRDLEFLRAHNLAGLQLGKALCGASLYHLARTTGATLGSRADMLSPTLRARLSLERRSSFEPLEELFEEPKVT